MKYLTFYNDSELGKIILTSADSLAIYRKLEALCNSLGIEVFCTANCANIDGKRAYMTKTATSSAESAAAWLEGKIRQRFDEYRRRAARLFGTA